jgi:ankyrin repeat protein
MKAYKILNKEENHHSLQYKTGLNIDPMPFNPSGDCKPGGIYYAREDILAFLNYGPWIREVTLPDGDEEYKNPGKPVKYKAHQVILGERKTITAEVIKQLLDEGANIHAWNDLALKWAAKYGHTETVRLLLDRGADIHAYHDEALKWAATHGYTKTVKLLLDRGANIHAWDDEALRWATLCGHTETVKLLLKRGADPNVLK